MRKTLLLLGCAGTLLLPNLAAAQAPPRNPHGSFWITPYVGAKFQGEYFDGVVQFADGDAELLRLDPGSGLVVGVQAGYRFAPAWTVHANLAYDKPDAAYVEDRSLRPTVDVRTTQFELGMLYDLATFPVGGKVAPFLIGGGLSLTIHSFDPFQWDDVLIAPSSSSLGVHGLGALDIPLTPRLSLRGQVKLTATSLALGDLNDKIAFAEGEAITIPLGSGISTHLVLSLGITIRL